MGVPMELGVEDSATLIVAALAEVVDDPFEVCSCWLALGLRQTWSGSEPGSRRGVWESGDFQWFSESLGRREF